MEDILTAVIPSIIGLLGVVIGFCGEIVLSKCNAKGERANHISQVRFDKEFMIYQELAEKNLTAVYDAGETVIIIRNNRSELGEDVILKHSEKFCNDLNSAQFSNKKYAPFISKNIYLKYKELENKLSDIHLLYKIWLENDSNKTYAHKGKTYSVTEATKEIIVLQKEVSSLSDEILDIVRAYLNGLDIMS